MLFTEPIVAIDNKNKILRFENIDPDDKYTFAMDVYLYDQKIDLSSYKEGDRITIVGTIKGFKNKDKSGPNRVLIRNAFIK